MGTLYSAWRVDGGPTIYEPLKTPFYADMVLSGLAFCFIILAVSFFVILPGIRSIERLFVCIRVTVSLFIGAVILVSIFGQHWETDEISTEMQYKAGTSHGITATVGLHIGIRGINITLKGDPEQQLNETINYNEHFSWEWPQGRLGFGPFAGRLNQEFRAAQYRGLPYPILWIAEYFTLDGEGIRWGRFYRWNGWYIHMLLWTAFATWILTNMFLFILVRHGGYCLMITGGCMLIANIIFGWHKNKLPLHIPFKSDAVLQPHFGWTFYLCLSTGIISVILGFVIFILSLRKHDWMAAFFGVDPLTDDDDIPIDDAATGCGFGSATSALATPPSTTTPSDNEPLHGNRVSFPDEGDVTQETVVDAEAGATYLSMDRVNDESEMRRPKPIPALRYVGNKNRFTKLLSKSQRRPRNAHTPLSQPPQSPSGSDLDAVIYEEMHGEMTEMDDNEWYDNAMAVHEHAMRLGPMGGAPGPSNDS